MGRPREHGERTRAALLAAASGLLAAEGPRAVTVRRLADEVSTTTRAVYALFGDKAGLLRALFRLAAETMRRRHEQVPVTDDPVAEMVELALAYRAAAREQPNLYALYFGCIVPKDQLGDDDRALAYRSFARVLASVRRCVETGRFPGHDPTTVGMQLWALVHGLASLELRGFLGDEQIAAQHWHGAVTAALLGYQTAPAPAPLP